jgi:Protein of unknown function (DUF2442)
LVTTDAEVDAAIVKARVYDKYRSKAVGAAYRPKGDVIVIKLASGVELVIPRKLMQGLESADPKDAADVRIDDHGSSLHWESLDVDHYVPGLIAGVFGTREWMAHIGKTGSRARRAAKRAASRRNGRKSGRPRKQPARS